MAEKAKFANADAAKEPTPEQLKEQKREMSRQLSAVLTTRNLVTQESLEQAGFVKATLPEFLPPDEIPIGSCVQALVKDVIGDFTGLPGMEDTENLWLLHEETKQEFLMPMTGVIKQATLRAGSGGIKGKRIAILRLPDGISRQFKNRMFRFEVYFK